MRPVISLRMLLKSPNKWQSAVLETPVDRLRNSSAATAALVKYGCGERTKRIVIDPRLDIMVSESGIPNSSPLRRRGHLCPMLLNDLFCFITVLKFSVVGAFFSFPFLFFRRRVVSIALLPMYQPLVTVHLLVWCYSRRRIGKIMDSGVFPSDSELPMLLLMDPRESSDRQMKLSVALRASGSVRTAEKTQADLTTPIDIYILSSRRI